MGESSRSAAPGRGRARRSKRGVTCQAAGRFHPSQPRANQHTCRHGRACRCEQPATLTLRGRSADGDERRILHGASASRPQTDSSSTSWCNQRCLEMTHQAKHESLRALRTTVGSVGRLCCTASPRGAAGGGGRVLLGLTQVLAAERRGKYQTRSRAARAPDGGGGRPAPTATRDAADRDEWG
jgi:hypothetical protein